MKTTIVSIIIAALFIFGAFWLTKSDTENSRTASVNNVSIVGDKQIVEITAKGGYLPERSKAKAGIPTVIRFDTKGTFDCSSSVRIPSMNISKILPQSGTTDIDIGIQPAGIFQGTCGMGMYPFQVNFQS